MNNCRASVVICTRNPREDYFMRVLAALTGQTLPEGEWELVIVDNGSQPAIESRRIALPRNSRVILESMPGLTAARLRGIRETKADLLVFVDDDNLLASDYLAGAGAIECEFPEIGVWGGRLLPEFEATPEDWMKPFWKNLALVDFERDRRTSKRDFSVFPAGAGMCVRRSVANDYAIRIANDRLRRGLDRIGNRLSSGGDTDMVLQAIDAGFEVGQFTRLSLTHLIPQERLTLGYHERLAEGISQSAGQMNAICATAKPEFLRHRIRGWLSVLRNRGPARTIAAAAARGWILGLKEGWEANRHASR